LQLERLRQRRTSALVQREPKIGLVNRIGEKSTAVLSSADEVDGVAAAAAAPNWNWEEDAIIPAPPGAADVVAARSSVGSGCWGVVGTTPSSCCSARTAANKF
jgi:hypothetical protein